MVDCRMIVNEERKSGFQIEKMNSLVDHCLCRDVCLAATAVGMKPCSAPFRAHRRNAIPMGMDILCQYACTFHALLHRSASSG